MNTFLEYLVLVPFGALGWFLVDAHVRLRNHRRQLLQLIKHHEDLRERFGKFMLKGGQEVMLAYANREWAAQQCLAQQEVSSGWQEKFCKDIEAHEAFGKKVNPANLGPMEDKDTAPALPPFPQMAKPNKDIITVTE